MLHRHELWLLQTRRPQFCAVPAAWYYCVRRHGRLALPGMVGLEPAITSGLTAITSGLTAITAYFTSCPLAALSTSHPRNPASRVPKYQRTLTDERAVPHPTSKRSGRLQFLLSLVGDRAAAPLPPALRQLDEPLHELRKVPMHAADTTAFGASAVAIVATDAVATAASRTT